MAEQEQEQQEQAPQEQGQKNKPRLYRIFDPEKLAQAEVGRSTARGREEALRSVAKEKVAANGGGQIDTHWIALPDSQLTPEPVSSETSTTISVGGKSA